MDDKNINDIHKDGDYVFDYKPLRFWPFKIADVNTVLVKKNFFTGNVKVSATVSDNKKDRFGNENPAIHKKIIRTIKIHDKFSCSDEDLDKIINENHELAENKNKYIILTKAYNIRTGKKINDGSLDNITINGSIKILDQEKISNEKLKSLSEKYHDKLKQNIFFREWEHRQLGESDSSFEDEELKNASYTLEDGYYDDIKYTIQKNTGIKLVWPWERIMVLSLTKHSLDSSPIKVDTSDRITMEFDTDYNYVITNPKKFSEQLNGKIQDYGNRAIEKLEAEIVNELDNIMTRYITDTGIDSLKKIGKDTIEKNCEPEISKVGKAYGIEITNFLMKSIKYPEVITQAEAAKIADLKKAEGTRSVKEAEIAGEVKKAGDVLISELEAVKGMYPDVPASDLFAILERLNASKTRKIGDINVGTQTTVSDKPQFEKDPVLDDNYKDYQDKVFDTNGTVNEFIWNVFVTTAPILKGQPIPKFNSLPVDIKNQLVDMYDQNFVTEIQKNK